MSENFKKYQRTELAELREVTENDIHFLKNYGGVLINIEGEEVVVNLSISEVDKKNGSPKLGDMIARNPKNHDDQWLVAKEYFLKNFKDVNINNHMEGDKRPLIAYDINSLPTKDREKFIFEDINELIVSCRDKDLLLYDSKDAQSPYLLNK